MLKGIQFLRVVGLLVLSVMAGCYECGCGEKGVTAGGDGWVRLFDGKTLEGWEGNQDYFRIEEGAIVLLPIPREMEMRNGTFALESGRYLHLVGDDRDDLLRTGTILRNDLETYGIEWELTTARSRAFHNLGLVLTVNPDLFSQAQGYRLEIFPDHIEITARDGAGAFYGAMTFRQILRQAAPDHYLPCLRILDYPDIRQRGIMMDVSRDKVPTMDTLFHVVDMMAELKMNELQLYMEHTFAYHSHQIVWKDATPFTGEDMLELDAYCRKRHVELVPNQNSFAHMGRWLQCDAYRGLAENPDSVSTINPADPCSLELLTGLYDEILPHFTSKKFNVGCDETSLGKHRSKALCDEKGVGQVYFDFLMQLYEHCQHQGRTMQFWADIIFHHPEFIPNLPRNIHAMLWGYEANHDYTHQTAKMREVGVPFYVCPGTSSWNSLLGRTDVMRGNIRNAAENGIKNGGIGFLLTDWGDHGHWQYLPVSFAGYGYGASVSWCLQANKDMDLARALDAHLFKDQAGVMGQLALDLGNVYQKCPYVRNASLPIYFLKGFTMAHNVFRKAKAEDFEVMITEIDRLLPNLNHTDMQRNDTELILAEYRNNAAMLKHACRMGIALMNNQVDKLEELPIDVRAELAKDIELIILDHRRLWLKRNRKGGLKDSVGRFEMFLEIYQQK